MRTQIVNIKGIELEIKFEYVREDDYYYFESIKVKDSKVDIHIPLSNEIVEKIEEELDKIAKENHNQNLIDTL